VSAAQTLARRYVPLRSARDIVERLLGGEEIAVELPLVEDFGKFEQELRDLGIRAIRQMKVDSVPGERRRASAE
jgi:hypothetical protein